MASIHDACQARLLAQRQKHQGYAAGACSSFAAPTAADDASGRLRSGSSDGGSAGWRERLHAQFEQVASTIGSLQAASPLATRLPRPDSDVRARFKESAEKGAAERQQAIAQGATTPAAGGSQSGEQRQSFVH
jgi:hypothetical protein